MTLSPEVHFLIQQEMVAGHYASEQEVVLLALQALRSEREAQQVEPLAHEAIRESFDDIAAGRVQSAEEFDRGFRARKSIGR